MAGMRDRARARLYVAEDLRDLRDLRGLVQRIAETLSRQEDRIRSLEARIPPGKGPKDG